MRIDPAAPVPNWDNLEIAFESDDALINYYDRQTGAVLMFSSYDDDLIPNQAVTREQVADDGVRFRRIEPVPSREKFAWMEKFVGTVRDARLAGRLEAALGMQRPFRRFKDALVGAERERWYAFERALLRRYIARWLADADIAVGAAPPWPELAADPEPTDEELRREAHACVERLPSSHLPRVAALLRSIVAEG